MARTTNRHAPARAVKTRRRRDIGIAQIDTTVRLPEDVLIRVEADSAATGKNNVSWQVTEILERHYGIDRSKPDQAQTGA